MTKSKWLIPTSLLDAIAGTLFFAIYLGGAWAILTHPAQFWVDQLYDDAYYYIGVVRSLANGHGSEFLAPFKTNGYQPLWTLLLWGSAKIFGTGDRSLALQIYTYSFLGTAAFAIVYKRLFGNAFIAIACALTFPYVSMLGMETSLIPLLFLLFMQSDQWFKKGSLASLIFLSRLDGMAVVLARDAVDLTRGKRLDLRHYMVIAPVAAIYFGFNKYEFGSPVPISGLAKAVGNISGENWGPIAQYLINLKSAGVLLLGALVLAKIKSKDEFSYKNELQTLSLTLFACVAYYAIKSGWPVWGWYSWPSLLITTFLAQGLFDLISLDQKENKSGIRSASNFAAKLIGSLIFIYSFSPAWNILKEKATLFKEAWTNHIQTETFGRRNVALVQFFSQRHEAIGTMFAMGDRAGSFGFFVGENMQFLHTEGLVGPYEYVEAMRSDKGKEFLDTQPIAYMIADRERYLTSGDTIGIIEPIQGLSAHVGPYLVCFPLPKLVLDQSYGTNTRYVFKYKDNIACPIDLIEKFQELRNTYQGVRKFSLPTRYQGPHLISKILMRHVDVP